MRQKIATYLLIAVLSLAHLSVFATEGMWLPQLLGRLNEKEMKGMGLKISAADIYNVNKGSLKDAIVSFGGFCTGEIISSKGLLLTNHHCGYDAIQKHSSLQHNYLDKGFWARSMQEELPNAGLTATFIVRIEDVTKAALEGVSASLTESERQSAIDKNLNMIKAGAKKEAWQETLIKPFFEGNQYFLFVTETYKDIRLVGAPPLPSESSAPIRITGYGPAIRATSPFFRVYAGKDNRPAEYSEDNVPYNPNTSCPFRWTASRGTISRWYSVSRPHGTNTALRAMKLTVEGQDPARVSMRDAALKVIDGFMRQDEQIKFNMRPNSEGLHRQFLEKWIGEMQGVRQTNGIQRRAGLRSPFPAAGEQQRRNTAAPSSGLLDSLNNLYKTQAPYAIARLLQRADTQRGNAGIRQQRHHPAAGNAAERRSNMKRSNRLISPK